MAVSPISTIPYRAAMPHRSVWKDSRLKGFNQFIAFAFVLSVLLGSIRIGMPDFFRPTVLVTLPCLLYLMIVNAAMLGRIVRSRFGISVLVLFLFLTVGHFLGNDLMPDFAGAYEALNIENLISIPLIIFGGIIVSANKEHYTGMVVGLTTALTVHILCIAILPPIVVYHAYGRMSGMLNDPNILLLHIVPVVFLLLGTMRWKYAYWLTPLALLPVIWATLQTLSRAGLISLLIGACIAVVGLACLLVRTRRWMQLCIMLLLFPFAMGAMYASNPTHFQKRIAVFSDRLTQRTDKSKSFLEDRLYWYHLMQQTTIDDHLFNPMGMGYFTLMRGRTLLPHNTFVDAYVMAGPIAAMLFLLLYLELAFRFVRSIVKRHTFVEFTLMNVLLLAFVISQALLISTLSVFTSKVNWILLGIAIGLYAFRAMECHAYPRKAVEA